MTPAPTGTPPRGVIGDTFHCWNHEYVRHALRTQLSAAVDALDCITGSGALDLPGSLNWYVPDQTLLIVEITSESNAETDRVVKRKRYAEYGAPLYLLVDRLDKTVTLFSGPGRLGYTGVDGPHAFGTPVRLPDPFGVELDTSGL
ncbi:Uma2 family endonuclease [Streptomyces lavendulae]|uniref:Uma2 family endonuclease n=1 Tax=Streptomyces lavendulae TaxID=1914 RepID=UPI0036A0C500